MTDRHSLGDALQFHLDVVRNTRLQLGGVFVAVAVTEVEDAVAQPFRGAIGV